MACNSTLDDLPNVHWNYVLGAVTSIISVMASLENLVVLIILYRYRELRTPSFKILRSLAMADFLTGTTVVPLTSAQYLNSSILHNCSVELIRRYLATALIGASTLTLGFISYDRCLHLVKLRKYQMRSSVMYTVLSVCWLIPFLIPLLRKVGNDEQIYSAIVITLGTVNLVTIVVAYIGVLLALKHHSNNSGSNDIMRTASNENERRAGITVIIIISLYTLMLIPVCIHHGLNSSQVYDKYFLAKTYNITMLFAVANSVVNPLIYCYRTPALKKRARQLLRLTRMTEKYMMKVPGSEENMVESTT